MNKHYTKNDWQEEYFAAISSVTTYGCKSLPCPRCGVLGFYSPRIVESKKKKNVRKYRACKFCGFWQEASGQVYKETKGKPYQCIHVFCKKCGSYDWRVPWVKDLGKCPKCKNKKLKIIQWAVNDPTHFFHKHKIKQWFGNHSIAYKLFKFFSRNFYYLDYNEVKVVKK